VVGGWGLGLGWGGGDPWLLPGLTRSGVGGGGCGVEGACVSL
jgi:hypothetical protein